jgi:hypothetical protein
MDITTATPAEIDTRIAAISLRLAEIQMSFRRADYILGGAYLSAEELAKTEDEVKALNAEQSDLLAELGLLTDAYRAQRWTRFYLVLNSNGHVHTSTECDTCFDDTDFGWLTQFSGTEQDEMGKLSGEAACARCFPNLPAEVMQAKRDARIDTPKRIAEREEREAAAAARDAKKAAKAAKAAAEAITNPDGTPVENIAGHVLSREPQVRSEYVNDAALAQFMAQPELVFQGGLSDEEHQAVCAKRAANLEADAARYLAALAHKAGVTTDEMAAQLAKKVQAAYRRIAKDAVEFNARNSF